jgi:hypothetical protein
MKKDAMFQFYSDTGIHADTDLVTLEVAKTLWDANKGDFIKLHEKGKSPEMVIWINCKDNKSYGDSIWHVDYDSLVKDGAIFKLFEVGAEAPGN